MISLDERKQLEKQLRFGDYRTAATIYKRNTGRSIHYRYLEKFIKGLRLVSGKTGTHRPLDMYAALAEAYQYRKTTEELDKLEAETMTAKAREIREKLAA